jgi:hypothetical protein
MTPVAFHHGQAQELYDQCAIVLAEAYARNPDRFVRKPPSPARVADRRLDQRARDEGGRSLNSNTKRLTELDRLRARTSSQMPLWATEECRMRAFGALLLSLNGAQAGAESGLCGRSAS